MENKIPNLRINIEIDQKNGQAGIYVNDCGYSQLVANILGVQKVKEDPSGFVLYGKDGIIGCVMKPRASRVVYDSNRGAWVSDDLVALCKKISEVTGEEISLQDAPNGYAIGTRDEDGNYWFGGCDPSNFININDCGLYEWRCEYPERNKAQELSALKSKE